MGNATSTRDIVVEITPWLDPGQAANYLGVKTRTLIEWRRNGRGPKYTRLGGINGRVRYSLDDLERYMRERSFSSTTAETNRPAA